MKVRYRSFRYMAALVLGAFLLMSVMPPQGVLASNLDLPAPGTMVKITSQFMPPVIKGIKIDPKNPLLFNFLIDPGQNPLSRSEKEVQYTNLIKYFLASLTTPEKDMWVNLSPYEHGRIISSNFRGTQMGRDMLAQDYILKQLTASLVYPEDALGKKFWSTVYERVRQQTGSAQEVPVNTLNKVWIIPQSATIFEKGNVALVTESHLKVLMDEDYLALDKQANAYKMGLESASAAGKIHTAASQVVRDIVIPVIEKEINEGKNFALLRQMYNSMILASWFKQRLKKHLLTQVYVNKDKDQGVKLENPQDIETVFQSYIKAYKKGVYNYIKEEADPVSGEMIPRKYFSGGYNFAQLSTPIDAAQAVIKTTDKPVGLDHSFDNVPVQLSLSDGALSEERTLNVRHDIAALINKNKESIEFAIQNMLRRNEYSDKNIQIALLQILHLVDTVTQGRATAADQELIREIGYLSKRLVENQRQGSRLNHQIIPDLGGIARNFMMREVQEMFIEEMGINSISDLKKELRDRLMEKVNDAIERIFNAENLEDIINYLAGVQYEERVAKGSDITSTKEQHDGDKTHVVELIKKYIPEAGKVKIGLNSQENEEVLRQIFLGIPSLMGMNADNYDEVGVGDHAFDPEGHGHIIDGRKFSFNNRHESTLVNSALDLRFLKLAGSIEEQFKAHRPEIDSNIKTLFDGKNLKGDLEGNPQDLLLKMIFNLIKQEVVYYINPNKHKLGNVFLVGDTIEEGGSCRHMGFLVAALLERFIKDGYLNGKVYYVGGKGHAWAVYVTSQGEEIVLDIAQGYIGSQDPKVRKYHGIPEMPGGYSYEEDFVPIKLAQEEFDKKIKAEQQVQAISFERIPDLEADRSIPHLSIVSGNRITAVSLPAKKNAALIQAAAKEILKAQRNLASGMPHAQERLNHKNQLLNLIYFAEGNQVDLNQLLTHVYMGDLKEAYNTVGPDREEKIVFVERNFELSVEEFIGSAIKDNKRTEMNKAVIDFKYGVDKVNGLERLVLESPDVFKARVKRETEDRDRRIKRLQEALINWNNAQEDYLKTRMRIVDLITARAEHLQQQLDQKPLQQQTVLELETVRILKLRSEGASEKLKASLKKVQIQLNYDLNRANTMANPNYSKFLSKPTKLLKATLKRTEDRLNIRSFRSKIYLWGAMAATGGAAAGLVLYQSGALNAILKALGLSDSAQTAQIGESRRNVNPISEKEKVKDTVGGIDFDGKYLQMNLQGDGIDLPVPQGFEWMINTPISGFIPKILDIQSGVGYQLSFFKGVVGAQER